jgi:hypothetical protein
MENIFKNKYLKYKIKYLSLKNQKGGQKYEIYNFRPDGAEAIMAEVITYSNLQAKMTSHGLGSGVYGFINPDNGTASNYSISGNKAYKIELNNPLILGDNKEIIDGDIKINDISVFQEFSSYLNRLCFYLFDKKKDITDENIKDYTRDEKNNEFIELDDVNGYKLTLNKFVSLEIVKKTITQFLSDYASLETINTKENNKNYVLMPINYIMEYYGFDGIINKEGDTGNEGSVKYFFDNTIKARGYVASQKKEISIAGRLIFNSIKDTTVNIPVKKRKLEETKKEAVTEL